MIEQFSDWFQRGQLGYYIAVAIVLGLLGMVRSANEHARPKSPIRPTLPATREFKTVEASPRSNTGRKFLPFMRWLLFVAALLVTLIGIQEIYAELNPRGRFSQPEVSWLGALLVATGVAALWFGRPWFSSKSGPSS